jgi:hypothetical protein
MAKLVIPAETFIVNHLFEDAEFFLEQVVTVSVFLTVGFSPSRHPTFYTPADYHHAPALSIIHGEGSHCGHNRLEV